jgi:hypothetical protein
MDLYAMDLLPLWCSQFENSSSVSERMELRVTEAAKILSWRTLPHNLMLEKKEKEKKEKGSDLHIPLLVDVTWLTMGGLRAWREGCE